MAESNEINVKIKYPTAQSPLEVKVNKDITRSSFWELVVSTFPDDSFLSAMNKEKNDIQILVKGRNFKQDMKLSDIPDVSDGISVYLVKTSPLPPKNEEEEEEEEVLEKPKPKGKGKDKNSEPDKPYVPEPDVEIGENPSKEDIMQFVFRLQKLFSRFGMLSAQLQSNMDGIEVEPANKSFKEFIEFWDNENKKFIEYRNKIAELRNLYYNKDKDDMIPLIQGDNNSSNKSEENKECFQKENNETETQTNTDNNQANENNDNNENVDDLIQQICLTEEEIQMVSDDIEAISARTKPPTFGVDYGLNRTNKLYNFLK